MAAAKRQIKLRRKAVELRRLRIFGQRDKLRLTGPKGA
jgi:hypothetical protein